MEGAGTPIISGCEWNSIVRIVVYNAYTIHCVIYFFYFFPLRNYARQNSSHNSSGSTPLAYRQNQARVVGVRTPPIIFLNLYACEIYISSRIGPWEVYLIIRLILYTSMCPSSVLFLYTRVLKVS